jgi:hypothetical protein
VWKETIMTPSNRAGSTRAISLRDRWQAFRYNPHVCAECYAATFLLIAIVAAFAGLRIAPLACIVLAVAIFGADIYSLFHKD